MKYEIILYWSEADEGPSAIRINRQKSKHSADRGGVLAYKRKPGNHMIAGFPLAGDEGFEPAGSRLKWLYFLKFPWCADFRADFYSFGSTTSKSVRASRRTSSSS